MHTRTQADDPAAVRAEAYDTDADTTAERANATFANAATDVDAEGVNTGPADTIGKADTGVTSTAGGAETAG